MGAGDSTHLQVNLPAELAGVSWMVTFAPFQQRCSDLYHTSCWCQQTSSFKITLLRVRGGRRGGEGRKGGRKEGKEKGGAGHLT